MNVSPTRRLNGRVRVSPPFDLKSLHALYDEPWEPAPDDHPHLVNCPNKRIDNITTIAFGKGFGKVRSIADLSAGQADIPLALGEYSGVTPILGDWAEGFEYDGPMEDTIHEIPAVELFVCTNTIEHLNDPDGVLREIRKKCEKLLVSTPVDEWDEQAGGHYWAWSRGGVEQMLDAAGFTVQAFCELDLTPEWDKHLKHGMWACR